MSSSKMLNVSQIFTYCLTDDKVGSQPNIHYDM